MTNNAMDNAMDNAMSNAMNNVVSMWAVVRDGVVENIVLWNGHDPYDPGHGARLVPLPFMLNSDGTRHYTGDIGWVYANGAFSPADQPQ
jgi:hypothetical protein